MFQETIACVEPNGRTPENPLLSRLSLPFPQSTGLAGAVQLLEAAWQCRGGGGPVTGPSVAARTFSDSYAALCLPVCSFITRLAHSCPVHQRPFCALKSLPGLAGRAPPQNGSHQSKAAAPKTPCTSRPEKSLEDLWTSSGCPRGSKGVRQHTPRGPEQFLPRSAPESLALQASQVPSSLS